MNPKYFLVAIVLLAIVALAPNSFAQANPQVSFATLKDLIDVLPHPLVQELKISTKIEGARERANDLFRQNAVGKTATMTLRASEWHDETGADKLPKIKIWALAPPHQYFGNQLHCAHVDFAAEGSRCPASEDRQGRPDYCNQ
jgi:hypothetical protein